MSKSIFEKIAVIGQGYVGFPLAMEACKVGYSVVGFDISSERIAEIKDGNSPTEDVSSDILKELFNSKRYIPTTDINILKECQIFIICVPTPLDNEQNPDLTPLISAVDLVSKHIKPDDLIIIESTIAPGTTRNIILPLIEKISKLDSLNFGLVYSPERIDPLNKEWNVSNTPKLVSGLDIDSVNRANKFYNKFVTKVYVCDSFEVAETAKLLENSFRFINISFINELSIFCHSLGIDIKAVIEAANTKPYGFMPFYPSVGIGGHCIPVDPLYLAEKAREIGAPIKFINLANQVNQEIPGYFVGRAEEKIGALKGKRVLVIGVSYKPNVADVRESPVEALITALKQKGSLVAWHDDLVKEWNGEKSVTLSTDFDLAIIATPHDYLDLRKLGNVPILNTRGSI